MEEKKHIGLHCHDILNPMGLNYFCTAYGTMALFAGVWDY